MAIAKVRALHGVADPLPNASYFYKYIVVVFAVLSVAYPDVDVYVDSLFFTLVQILTYIYMYLCVYAYVCNECFFTRILLINSITRIEILC